MAVHRRRSRKARIGIDELAEGYGVSAAHLLSDEGSPDRAHAARDLAFGHFLVTAHRKGIFKDHRSVEFIGGTALRKTRFGAASRMSTDLDFRVPENMERHFWEGLQGAGSGPFAFHPYQTDKGRGRLRIKSDLFPGGEDIVHLDLSQNPRLMRSELKSLLPSPLDDTYRQPSSEGWLPVMPVIENAAGKLGRWYDRPLIRDLYDLARLAPQLHDGIEELAEVAVCMTAHRLGRPQPLIVTPFAGEEAVDKAEFGSLAKRLDAEPVGPGWPGYILTDLSFVPEMSETEKAAVVADCLQTVLGLTDAMEAAIKADRRLLRIAWNAPDAYGLAGDLDNELRARYGTDDDFYRFGGPRPSARRSRAMQPTGQDSTTASAVRRVVPLPPKLSGSLVCGAATGTTDRPCRNKVSRPGRRCHLHR